MARRAALASLVVLVGTGIAASLYFYYRCCQVSYPVAIDGGSGVSPGAVGPGFVGAMQYGDWRLICAAAPAAAEPADPLALAEIDPAGKTAANACRLSHEAVPGDAPDSVILAANLSLVGPQRRPALMLRLPAAFREGDHVAIRADTADAAEAGADSGIYAKVYDCAASQCMAAAELTDTQWRELTGAGLLQAVFLHPGGQRVYIDIGVAGLKEAVSALRQAQGGS